MITFTETNPPRNTLTFDQILSTPGFYRTFEGGTLGNIILMVNSHGHIIDFLPNTHLGSYPMVSNSRNWQNRMFVRVHGEIKITN